MNVVNLVSSVSRIAGGMQHSVSRLVIETSRLGAGVTTYTLADEFTEADIRRSADYAVRTFALLGPRIFGYSPQLVGALTQANVDLVHVHGIWMYPSLASFISNKRKRRPYVISPHGMLDPWAVKNSHWKKVLAGCLYENRHLGGATCLRALCESEANSMRSYGLRNPIAIIPNGQDLVPEQGDETTLDELLPADRKVLLFLGRLHPKKGIPALLRGWARARSQNKKAGDWTLVIAGWDQSGHESMLKKMATDLGIADSVLFPGPLFKKQKDAALRRANAFVLPSLSEGLPMAILEAWSYRLPVLMTPQCNLPEGFAAGAAFRCEPNEDSIRSAMEGLFEMSDHDLRDLGNRGRDLVGLRFSWTSVGSRMIEVYNWMVGAGPLPDCVRIA